MNGIMDLFMQDKFEDAKEVIEVGQTVQWKKNHCSESKHRNISHGL